MKVHLLLVALVAIPALAQNAYPPAMPEARQEVYKSVEGTDLKLWIFEPEDHQATDRRPAIVFFFGGGWRSGNPNQFYEHSKYLASRGMVAIAADYRVQSRHGVKAIKCVEDAKAAMRWVRANALSLGVDPDRIAAGGGSAGGHLAAAAATLPGHDDPAGDQTISPVPNALALFNPATVLAPAEDYEGPSGLKERIGAPPRSFSPYHHVWYGAPPTILFHGKADATVPYQTAEMFCAEMRRKGSSCRLEGYEGKTHGFFNYGRDGGEAYSDTVRKMDEFFVSLGWLKGQPTIAPTE